MTKTCKACLKTLHVDRFNRSTRTLDGLEGKCKECRVNERPLYTFTCVICDDEYTTRKRTSNQCCSQKCVGALRTQNQTKEVPCGICGESLRVPISNKFNSYCSADCFSQACAIRMSGENHHSYSQVEATCFNCGETIYRTQKYLEKITHAFCDRECFSEGIGVTRRGENHHGYDFDKTEEDRIRERSYFEYNEWRKEVYKRDSYTCSICGSAKSGTLNAHHLYSYHSHPDLRVDLENGITVCEICHKEFHSLYGYKYNTPYEFVEFQIGVRFRNTDPHLSVIGDLDE